MARLYETVAEQKARELQAYYAGEIADPATFPPKTRSRRARTKFDGIYVTNEDLVTHPRYQTAEAMVRKAVNEGLRSVRAFNRISRASQPKTPTSL